MAVNGKTPEELAAELQAEETAAQAQIDAVAQQAGADASAQGATQAEINQAVEKARTEEKDKLYPQIQGLKDAMKEIQETLRQEREEKDRIKADADAEKERARLAKLSDSEKMVEALRKLEEKLEQERTAREASELRLIASQQAAEVSRYRERVIKAAGDEIIEDLVRGDTVEEIDRTVAIAKARYAEFADRFKQAQGAGVRNSMGRTSTNPGTEALEEQELSEQLTAVDQDKYLADPVYREKIKAELAGAYRQAAGRA